MDSSNTVFGQHIIKLLISVAKDIKLLQEDILDIKTSINRNMIKLKTVDPKEHKDYGVGYDEISSFVDNEVQKLENSYFDNNIFSHCVSGYPDHLNDDGPEGFDNDLKHIVLNNITDEEADAVTEPDIEQLVDIQDELTQGLVDLGKIIPNKENDLQKPP